MALQYWEPENASEIIIFVNGRYAEEVCVLIIGSCSHKEVCHNVLELLAAFASLRTSLTVTIFHANKCILLFAINNIAT